MKISIITTFIISGMGPLLAGANTGDAALFNSLYPSSRSFSNFSCAICHKNIAVNTNLTAYGVNYKAMGRNQATSITGIEAVDSDVDGFANIQEIMAGSNPGDPMSNPNNVPDISAGGGGGGGSSGGQNQALQANDFDLRNTNMLSKTSCALVNNAETSMAQPDIENILVFLILMFVPFLSVAILKSQLQVLN